ACHGRLELAQVAGVLLESRGGNHGVDVVEGEIAHAEACEEIECRFELAVGHFLGDGQAEPGSRERAGAEDILSRPIEGVPIADGHAQPILHALAEDLPILVIYPVRKLIAAVGTLEGHRLDAREQGHVEYSAKAGLRSRYSRRNIGRRSASSRVRAASG